MQTYQYTQTHRHMHVCVFTNETKELTKIEQREVLCWRVKYCAIFVQKVGICFFSALTLAF